MKVAHTPQLKWFPGYMVFARGGAWLHHQGYWFKLEEPFDMETTSELRTLDKWFAHNVETTI